MKKNMKAIYAGSFDPFTLGHKSIVDKGLEEFSAIVIVVAHNPGKEGYFSEAQKIQIIKSYFPEDERVSVEIVSGEYVASFAARKNINHLIRGIRNQHDKDYEKNIEAINKTINEKIEVVYFKAEKDQSHISSSLVKSLLKFPEWQRVAQTMVSPKVISFFLDKMTRDDLYKEWSKLSENDKWFDFIMKKHTESHRHYHNTFHLLELFNQFRELKKNCSISKKDREVISYSIFFHDLVYDPKSMDNEDDSAKKWMEFSEKSNNKISKKTKDKVLKTILATKSHSNDVVHEISKYFLDLDLSILGSDPIKYHYYEKEIREEYGFVPEEIFNKERLKVMRKLVSPFKTEWGVNKFGKNCRINLSKYKK